eukprot:CAMPEP_0118952110 /NCGR_PEP_ID=MMETSP1169-20130426/54250_1 /TAXON_ID=36882 /ORGANISM="Pyramimonas obovata, Strain CCMP722" /LENGTH=376 /DNA_ID=CAMNT_0006899277 /DNA_START=270 /DNA_END=1400 /DNA_ORIENTATION=-
MLCEEFPLLLPESLDLSVYHGFLNLKDCQGQQRKYWIRVENIPKAAGSMRGAILSCDSELRQLLKALTPETLQGRLGDSPDLRVYLLELQELAGRLLQKSSCTYLPAHDLYTKLMEELDQVGWYRLEHLDPSLRSLRLRFTDAGGRCHSVEVSFPANYPTAAPTCLVDLPEALVLRWQAGYGLQQIASQVEARLESYQVLWDGLDDLDANVWVLEPEQAPRAATHRRVALGGHTSLTLTLNPKAPLQPPDFHFMGAESKVAALRSKLLEYLPRWNASRLPRLNLEAALQMPLPARGTSELEDVSSDCAICYAYNITMDDGEYVPEHNCDNPGCGRPYHACCLREWLQANSDTRQSFNVLFGACPYCSAPISVKLGV